MNLDLPTRSAGNDGAAYVSEAKIYPRGVRGPLWRLRYGAAFLLLGIFYLFPWLQWDGHQAVLLDLPARKFHIFAITFWPQDFLYLALLRSRANLAMARHQLRRIESTLEV